MQILAKKWRAVSHRNWDTSQMPIRLQCRGLRIFPRQPKMEQSALPGVHCDSQCAHPVQFNETNASRRNRSASESLELSKQSSWTTFVVVGRFGMRGIDFRG